MSGASITTTVVLKQAALDTKHKMGPAAERLTLIHFNDVYNVDPRDREPEGGAARYTLKTPASFIAQALSPFALKTCGQCYKTFKAVSYDFS